MTQETTSKNTPRAGILNYVGEFQTKAQKVMRYIGNPYVKGDNVAEHIARLVRLVVCIAPMLKQEFPDEKDLVEKLFATVILHDDDEVIDGFDIITSKKEHNVKDNEEIKKFSNAVQNLDKETQEYVIDLFSSFRKKDTLVSKIAKALDNIAGNQLVIEQQIGLINPHQAKFSIEYVLKVKGISKTVDNLIEAQVKQIIDYRKNTLSDFERTDLPKQAKKLLEIDVLDFSIEKEKINTPLEELYKMIS